MINWKKKLTGGLIVGHTYNYYYMGHKKGTIVGQFQIIEMNEKRVTKMLSLQTGDICSDSRGWDVEWFGE